MNSVGPFTDQSFQDLQSGSNRAWAQFYDLLAPELRAYIVRLGAKDPDDILGETFAHAYRDIPKFLGKPDELRPWIFRIAHNRVIDAARRRKSRPTEVYLDPETDFVGSLSVGSDEVDLGRLSELLEQLTEDQREAVWLRYVAGFSLSETATILDKSQDATAAITFRAMTALRKYLSTPS